MTKFNIGDYVVYSNKNLGLSNVQGRVIATRDVIGSGYAIEPIDSRFGLQRIVFYRPIYAHTVYDSLSFERFPQGVRSLKFGFWAAIKSKNLRPLVVEYDPNQTGDTDDDI